MVQADLFRGIGEDGVGGVHLHQLAAELPDAGLPALLRQVLARTHVQGRGRGVESVYA